MAAMHLERLEGLQPHVREKAIAAFKQGEREGLGLLVATALRSFEEQGRLYAQGRTAPGKIVTNAEPGESYHNYGLAFDFVVVRDGKAIWDQNHPHWQRFVHIAKGHGFEWGGDWKKFPDYPHFQIKRPPALTTLLAQYPRGYRPGAKASVAVGTWIAKDQLPLKKGNKDGRKKLVSRLQQGLRIEADGYYGAVTETAVKRWQTVHDEKGERVPKGSGSGLSRDGIVGEKTWAALFGKLP